MTRQLLMIRPLAIASCLLVFAVTGRGRSIKWSPNPVSGDWYTPENWIPHTIPDGRNDTAVFFSSSITHLSLASLSESQLGRMLFRSDNNFIVDIEAGSNLTMDGAGILGPFATIVVLGDSTSGSAELKFVNRAMAGGSGSFIAQSGNPGGIISFYGNSSSGSLLLYDGYRVEYHDRSKAAGTYFSVYPDDGVNPAAVLSFSDQAEADGSTFGASESSNQTVGPTIYLNDDSTAAGATVELSDISVFDISGHLAPGVTIGTLMLRGQIYLGANNLSVTQSNFSPFYGSIHDGGASGGTGGSLTLLYGPTLTLSGPSDYTGGTFVEGGCLVASFSGKGSVTGLGTVHVDSGELTGHGTIAGAVIVGTGAGQGASLNPGIRLGSGQTLTIQQSLTFASDAIYKASVNSNTATANQVTAEGATIASGAQLILTDAKNSALPSGTIFTLINNTAAIPIGGSFSNLPDGATIAAGANIYQASYSGGDGNDLTLTVIP